MISVEYSEAISEILDILENSDDTIKKRIPNELIQFWENNKSITYIPDLDHSKPLNEIKLKEKTKDIITMIYINYLCNEKEKEFTKNIIKENEKKYQIMLRGKYNSDNIFKNCNKENKENQETINMLTIVKYKESIFSKIIKSIKNVFGL